MPGLHQDALGSAEMNQEKSACRVANLELARSKRRRTMLMAQMQVGASQIDVRVRNLSQTGALVETKSPLKVGMQVLLRRADAEVAAVIARVQPASAGLCFEEPLDEQTFDVLSTGKSAPKSIPPMPPEDEAALSSPSAGNAALEAQIARELRYAQALLDHLSEPLLNDFMLVSQYSRNLQEIDRVRQLLGHLAEILGAVDKSAAIDKIGMFELRCRLQGKPILRTWTDEAA